MFVLYAVLFIITVALIANLIFVTIAAWTLEKSKLRLFADILLLLILVFFSTSYLNRAIEIEAESTVNKISIQMED